MNKRELVSKAVEVLHQNDIRKPVSTPKHVFHISDDEGNHKDFIVKQTNKAVLYNSEDVSAIVDACLYVVKEAIKHGEDVSIHGFGNLGVHKRAARTTIHPRTGEVAEVKERYVPKFSFGNDLRMAAKIYEMSLSDFKDLPAANIPEPDNELDGDE